MAVLFIGIGEYIKFWDDFYYSLEKNFLKRYIKEYFVFTDSKSMIESNKDERIHCIFQENLGWPNNTLFRFKMFTRVQEQLINFQYIFFMNANVVCIKEITADIFLPYEQDLVVVQHPGYFNKKNYEFPYERRKKSKAYIAYGKGENYVCGGINGGKAEKYLEAINTLKIMIEEDYQNGVVAKWHDESYLNKYILENVNYRLLSPAFCYPENEKLPFQEYLVVRDKKKVIELPDVKTRKQRGDRLGGIKRRILSIIFEFQK